MEKQNKVQLPFRTKIAAVIVFCVSLVVVSFLLLFILSIRNNYPVTQCPSGNLCDNIDYRQLSRYFAPMFLIIPFAGLLLFGAMGLFFLKKIGWWCGVLSVLLFDISYVFVMLVMFMSIENSIMIFILPLALTFIAFLLLITDRKNYFAALEKAKGGGGLTK